MDNRYIWNTRYSNFHGIVGNGSETIYKNNPKKNRQYRFIEDFVFEEIGFEYLNIYQVYFYKNIYLIMNHES